MAVITLHRPVTAVRRSGALPYLVAGFAAWRQRRALSRLDAHARRDLGLSVAEVMTETARPVWDVPSLR